MPLNAAQLKELIVSSPSVSQCVIKTLLAHIQNREKEVAIIFAINSLLSNAKNRTKGLELVTCIIPYCSLTALTENSILWASHCVVRHSNEENKAHKLRTLAIIVESSVGIDIFNKKFVSDHLSDTLKACLNAQNKTENIAALKCLIQCMKRYPSWFGNHKSKIEPFLVKFLESNVEKEVQEAALAFLYFQQTGGAGVEGINYTKNFHTQLNKLCGTLHMLYDQFFEGINEIDHTNPIEGDTIKFSVLPSNFDTQKTQESTSTRILNCIVFITTMIQKQYPVAKQLTSNHLLDVITRGLSLHVCLAEENISLETCNLSLLLNNVQVQLLKLLRHFIIGFLPSTLPFGPIITKTLLNAIKRFQNCECLSTDLLYQESAYKTLHDWLSLSDSGSQLHLQGQLFPILLKDISPISKKVVLNLAISGRNKSKRKQKAFLEEKSDSNEKTLHIIGDSLKESRCALALDVLKVLFTTSTINVNLADLQELISFIMKTLLDINAGRDISPYNSPNCQLKLYELLIALYKQDSLTTLPPLHTTIGVLSKGLNLSSYKIVQTCTEGLHFLGKISQPVCPSLYIPHIETPVKSQVINNIDLDAAIEDNSSIDSDEETTNKIHIISDILINESELKENGFSETKNGDIHLEETNEMDLESEKDITTITLMDETKDMFSDNLKEAVLLNDSVDDTVVIIDDSVEEETLRIGDIHLVDETGIADEPPTKKIRDDSNLDDMFSSFRDIVQE